MDRTIALIGCGKAGLSVALAMKNAGWSLAGCASGTPDSARRGSDWLACPVLNLPEDLPRSVPLIVAVPDRALSTEDRRIADEDLHLRGRIVLHLSGALPARALNACRLGGARVGSLHPIMTLPDPLQGAKRLREATFAIEGRPEAVLLMEAIARDISGRHFTLSPRTKTLYHAAAVTASNHLVALLSESQELLILAGADPALAKPAFEALVRGTLENFYASEAVQALTGPVERADEKIVSGHLKALRKWPERRVLYAALARKTLSVARRKHPEREEVYAVLEKLLV